MSNKFNFTKAEIDSLSIPDAGKRDTYHDTKTKGLQLRVTHTGVKTFSVFKRTKCGKPERITLGRYPDMTIDEFKNLPNSERIKFLGDPPELTKFDSMPIFK